MIRDLKFLPSRRALLRGAGVALPLPFLESLLPKGARAQAAARTRLVYWMINNGVLADFWNPTEAHKTPLDPAKAPRSFQPLVTDGVYQNVTIIQGLDNLQGSPDAVGDHASGVSAFLTCIHALKSSSQLRLGISVDQIAANALAGKTPRQSLELGLTPSSTRSDCDNGYACAYAGSISWNDPTTPRPKRTDPHDIWSYLIGAGVSTTPTTPMTPGQPDNGRRRDVSVLDFVAEQARSLSAKLAVSDRAKLDQYLTGVRTIEQQLSTVAPVAAGCHPATDPGTVVKDHDQRMDMIIELIVFAFQCDLTRVVSFMVGNAFGPGPMPWAGVTSDFHNLTHMEGATGNKELIQKCIDWEMTKFSKLLKRLKETPEGSSNLLANSTLYLSSEVGRGLAHNHDKKPVVVAGGGGGMINSGLSLLYQPEDPSARTLAQSRRAASIAQALTIPNSNKTSNLLVTLLETVGVRGAKLGDSSGRIADIVKTP